MWYTTMDAYSEVARPQLAPAQVLSAHSRWASHMATFNARLRHERLPTIEASTFLEFVVGAALPQTQDTRAILGAHLATIATSPVVFLNRECAKCRAASLQKRPEEIYWLNRGEAYVPAEVRRAFDGAFPSGTPYRMTPQRFFAMVPFSDAAGGHTYAAALANRPRRRSINARNRPTSVSSYRSLTR